MFSFVLKEYQWHDRRRPPRRYPLVEQSSRRHTFTCFWVLGRCQRKPELAFGTSQRLDSKAWNNGLARVLRPQTLLTLITLCCCSTSLGSTGCLRRQYLMVKLYPLAQTAPDPETAVGLAVGHGTDVGFHSKGGG